MPLIKKKERITSVEIKQVIDLFKVHYSTNNNHGHVTRIPGKFVSPNAGSYIDCDPLLSIPENTH